MRKKSETKYFDRNRTEYLYFIGNDCIGKFDGFGNALGRVNKSLKDMFCYSENGNIYLIRVFKRKGICLIFRTDNNGVDLSEPKVYSLPSVKECELINLWEGII